MYEAFEVLKSETNELLHYDTEVLTVDKKYVFLESFSFYRDHVAGNTPLLIKGCCSDWPATTKWNNKYFKNIIGEKEVLVDITPNGYADGLISKTEEDGNRKTIFALPEQKIMKMKEFLGHLENPLDNYICYIQYQNSNLVHFEELMPDVPQEVAWASEAFGKSPDAVNFWMGDRRAITSMHKDPYENIYCVIDGYKDFILIPPTDLPWVPHDTYQQGTFRNVTTTSYEIEMTQNPDSEIRWISVDPLDADYAKYPEFRRASIYNVRVHKGDVLYLPSLWFHHVRQSHGCIAVNYWYDMDYDIKYCYYKMIEEMCKKK